MGQSPGRLAYQMSFELSPIIFTGGIAGSIPGGMLPIILITQALSFVQGILSGGDPVDFDDFFAHFVPLAGSKLASNQYAKIPFANQAVAANARIKQPRGISMKMICPAKDEGGFAVKLATMTALEAAVEAHTASGGTFTVATPSFFYTNCLLLDITDTSSGNSNQAQNTYQWDFEQPLLTLQDAVQSQNNLMSQITAGTPIAGAPTWSGLAPTTGLPPSLGAVGTIPAASGPAGIQTAAPSLGLGQ
jgi:hypothetical protein